LAARRSKDKVGMEEMLAAVERVTMGPEKKNRVTSKKEKEMTAYHEAGHALLSLLMDEVDTFTKVSIILADGGRLYLNASHRRQALYV